MHEYPKSTGYYSQYEKEHPEEVFNTSNRINEAFANVPEWIQKFDFTLPEGYYTRYRNELCIDRSKKNRIRFHNGLLAIVDIISIYDTKDADLFTIYADGGIYTITRSEIWGYNSNGFKYSALSKHFDSYICEAWKIARKYLREFCVENRHKIHRSRLYQNLKWTDALME